MTDTTGALIKSIDCLDASRRVGWAKMFDAKRRADMAEQDLNIVREDAELLCRFGAFTYGVLYEIGAESLVREDERALKSFFADGPFRAGGTAAQAWVKQRTEREYMCAERVKRLGELIADRQNWLDHLHEDIKELRRDIAELAKTDPGIVVDSKRRIAAVGRELEYAENKLARVRQEARDAKTQSAEDHDKMFAAARSAERETLAAEYGFEDVEALLACLAGYEEPK